MPFIEPPWYGILEAGMIGLVTTHEIYPNDEVLFQIFMNTNGQKVTTWFAQLYYKDSHLKFIGYDETEIWSDLIIIESVLFSSDYVRMSIQCAGPRETTSTEDVTISVGYNCTSNSLQEILVGIWRFGFRWSNTAKSPRICVLAQNFSTSRPSYEEESTPIGAPDPTLTPILWGGGNFAVNGVLVKLRPPPNFSERYFRSRLVNQKFFGVFSYKFVFQKKFLGFSTLFCCFANILSKKLKNIENLSKF